MTYPFHNEEFPDAFFHTPNHPESSETHFILITLRKLYSV